MKLWVAILLLVANTAFASTLLDNLKEDLSGGGGASLKVFNPKETIGTGNRRPQDGVYIWVGDSKEFTLNVFDGPSQSFLKSVRNNPETIEISFGIGDGPLIHGGTAIGEAKRARYQKLTQQIVQDMELNGSFNHFAKAADSKITVTTKDLRQEQFNGLIDFVLIEMEGGVAEMSGAKSRTSTPCEVDLTSTALKRVINSLN